MAGQTKTNFKPIKYLLSLPPGLDAPFGHGELGMASEEKDYVDDIMHGIDWKRSSEHSKLIAKETTELIKLVKSPLNSEEDYDKQLEMVTAYSSGRPPNSMRNFGIAFETAAQDSILRRSDGKPWSHTHYGVRVNYPVKARTLPRNPRTNDIFARRPYLYL